MSPKSKTAPATDEAAPGYEPDAYYSVTLSKAATFGKASYSPRHNPHRMRGAVVNELKDSVANAQRIQ